MSEYAAIESDYCICNQHLDHHDAEMHDMRMDARQHPSASIESVSWDDDGPEYVTAPAGTGYASCTRAEDARLTAASSPEATGDATDMSGCPRCGYHDIETAWSTDCRCNDCHFAWNQEDRVPARLTTPSPERNIAAELAVALDHLTYVSHWATLDGAEQASLSTGIRVLRELHAALTA